VELLVEGKLTVDGRFYYLLIYEEIGYLSDPKRLFGNLLLLKIL